MAVEPQAVLQGSDQRGPLLVLAERSGADHAEPAGDLFPAGAGQQSGAVQADSRVGEGGRDAFVILSSPILRVPDLVRCVEDGVLDGFVSRVR